jgi:polar amino acid transport system substrate-binding protein
MLLCLLLAAAFVAFTACGDDDDDDDDEGTPAATASPAPTGGGDGIDISGVPELEDGVLTIGSDIAYAPIEYYEEGTTNEKGMDVDIARALAEVLGVEVEFQQVADFAGIVGDLKAARYDIVMSAISITEERQAEIDFVAYFGPVGTGILTKAGNPEGFQSVEDLCGHPVAAQDGTYQIDQMNALNETECADDPIDIRAFPDNPTAVQELILGRVDAELADDPVAAYSALQSEENLIELAVPGFESAPYGIGVRKDSGELKAALEAAFQAIRDDGTYDDILEEWGQTEFALD